LTEGSTLSVQPVSQEFGSYLVDRLKPVAEKLDNLRKKFPPYFTREQQGGIHLASGFAALTIGDQTGERKWTQAATGSFEAALTVFSPSDNSDYWVAAQVGLGNARANLGRHEVETQNLKAALAAFNVALETSTQNKITQALIQHDRGEVLAMLGDREAGKGWL
jgi:hypothetical protein